MICSFVNSGRNASQDNAASIVIKAMQSLSRITLPNTLFNTHYDNGILRRLFRTAQAEMLLQALKLVLGKLLSCAEGPST